MKINFQGPYLGKDGFKRIFVCYYTDDGILIKKVNTSHNSFLRNKENGLYDFPLYETEIIKSVKENKEKPNIKTKCFVCSKEHFRKHISFNSHGVDVCSNDCLKKYKRRKKTQRVFRLTNQILIKINENTDQKYYIVINLNSENKQAFLVERQNSKLVISEDIDLKMMTTLYYDEEKAVRVALVPGKYKKLFWITDTGILISRRTSNVLSQTVNQKGYFVHATIVGGCNGKAIAPRIHQLVARAFCELPERHLDKTKDDLIVNHKDGNKQNNHWTNLEWVTYAENSQHAYETGLTKVYRGLENKNSKLTTDDVREIRRLSSLGYSNRKISRELVIERSSINRVVNRTRYQDVI